MVLANPTKDSKDIQLIETIFEVGLVIFILSIALAFVYYPKTVGNDFLGVYNSILSVPISAITGIYNTGVSVVIGIYNSVSHAVTGAGSFIYNHTIGAL